MLSVSQPLSQEASVCDKCGGTGKIFVPLYALFERHRKDKILSCAGHKQSCPKCKGRGQLDALAKEEQ